VKFFLRPAKKSQEGAGQIHKGFTRGSQTAKMAKRRDGKARRKMEKFSTSRLTRYRKNGGQRKAAGKVRAIPEHLENFFYCLRTRKTLQSVQELRRLFLL
jgi:hypothetical protein